MPTSRFSNRQDDNQQRLRAYDAAQNATRRGDLSQERVDIARERMALDQASKEREMAFKVQESANRTQAAEARTGIAEKQLELSRMARELEAKKAETNMEDTIRATQDKIGFLDATRNLREDQEDFDTAISDAMAKFPHASKDDFVQKRTDWLVKSRSGYVERKQAEDQARKLGMVPKSAAGDKVTYESPTGTETIKDGERTVTRPIPPPGTPEAQQRDLIATHNTLEAGLKDPNGAYLKGDELKAQIAKINPVKAQLGYAQLDANGQPIATVAVAPAAAAPTAGPAKVATPDEFHSLPSGAEFIDPQGVKRRKP